jgi:hypothetical protein
MESRIPRPRRGLRPGFRRPPTAPTPAARRSPASASGLLRDGAAVVLGGLDRHLLALAEDLLDLVDTTKVPITPSTIKKMASTKKKVPLGIRKLLVPPSSAAAAAI